MATILIVDDDPSIREVVRLALARAGFGTSEARDGGEALRRIADGAPDLVVLDVTMPGLDGIEVVRTLRRMPGPGGRVPVLFLSSRDEEVDRIVGLEIGGDDYLTKPFSPRELVARIRALLRRPPLAAADAPGLRHGALAFDPDRVSVTWEGAELPLSAVEIGILRTLLARPGRVYSRDELMDRAYATERVVSDRTIDSHIRRVRARFEALGVDPIETVPGFGYRLGKCTPGVPGA